MNELTTETGDMFCTVECSECPYNLRFKVCGPDETLDGKGAVK